MIKIKNVSDNYIITLNYYQAKKIEEGVNYKMPNAVIDGPPIKDLEVKRVLVKEITDAMEKAYKIPRQAYVVLIKENLPENVGVGGELIIDRETK